MFCVNCGTQCGITDGKCPSCGNPLPSADNAIKSAPADEPVRESCPAPESASFRPTPPIENPPYAVFVSEIVGSFLLFSVAVFNVGDAVGRNRWSSTPSTVIASVVACLLFAASRRAWKRIVAAEPQTDLRLKSRHRDIILTSGFVALIFFVISGIVGWGIGRSGAETKLLLSDSGRVAAIAHRISEARTATEKTVQSHVAMYEHIERDVQEYRSALGRLRNDWTVYEAKFPEQHQQITKRIAELDIELRRTGLLMEQIAVAKTIKALDERQQFPAWANQMEPLLDKEAEFDNPK